MKTLLLAVALSLLVVFSFSGCSSNQVNFELTYDDFMQESDYTWEANVNEGDTIVISLGSNPSTGYSWTEQPDISEESIVKLIDHEFAATTQTDIAGAPGLDIYTFSAKQKGTAVISMDYKRAWEGAAEWTFTATINVK
jgi:inhibitor of cysteine peptidase